MECSLGADEEDEEALMQRALELSLKDMSTEEVATHSTNMDTQVASGGAEEEEDEVRAWEEKIQHNTLPYYTVPYNTVQYSTTPF